MRFGRPVRLELNAQRVTAAMAFYQEVFAWKSVPLHHPPWGSIPLIANGERVFGNEFMAMGAFAQSKWLIWFSSDVAQAESAARDMGGDVGDGAYSLGTLGTLLDATDPAGNTIRGIELAEPPPDGDRPGDPHMAGLWGKEASRHADFYAAVLGLSVLRTEHGATLMDGNAPRIVLHDVPFDIPRPIWVPYFLSTGIGGDAERAKRAGAIQQIPQQTVEDIGEGIVLSDPSGAYFGLIDPTKG